MRTSMILQSLSNNVALKTISIGNVYQIITFLEFPLTICETFHNLYVTLATFLELHEC